MKSTVQILVKDIVNDTQSNIDGVKLFCSIDIILGQNSNIILEVNNDMILSSSFLNSSLGCIIDKYGYQKIKDNLKIKCNKPQFERLSSYLYKYNELYHK